MGPTGVKRDSRARALKEVQRQGLGTKGTDHGAESRCVGLSEPSTLTPESHGRFTSMFSIIDSSCPARQGMPTRRELLRIGGLALGGLACPSLWRGVSCAAGERPGASRV